MAADAPMLVGADLDHAVSVLNARIDELFRIAERLDVKARQAFALAAAFFGGAQAIAFSSFAERGVGSAERVVLLTMAILATAALLVTAHRLTASEQLRGERGSSPTAIAQWYAEADGRAGYISTRIVALLVAVAEERRASVKRRGEAYRAVEAAARWVLILAVAESMTGIVTRL